MEESLSALGIGAIALRLAVVAALVGANAFFVAAEFALVGVRRSRIEELASEGHPQAKVVQQAIQDLDRYIAGTQLGITIASLGLGWVGEATLASILAVLLQKLGIGETGVGASPQVTAHGLAIPLAFAGITFFHVVLGELVPKSVALQYPDATALSVGRPMQLLVHLMHPFIWLLNGAGLLTLRVLGIREPPPHHQLHTVEELKILVDASHEGGVLDETEREILQRVFHFSEVTARQVMVHRTQMQCVPVDITYEDLLQVVREAPFSRFPVYEESMDNIIGILHLKDLFRTVGDPKQGFNLRAVIRSPLFVPETLSIALLLDEFRRKRAQMAIVLDEFGGTAGLVTLKDVLDEIVGHVHEEFEKEPEIVRGDNGVIWLKGTVRLDDLNNEFNLHIEEPDADTVAGLLMNRLGRVPVVGDVVTEGPVRFQVEAVSGRRVSRVKMRLHDTPSDVE